MLEGLFYLVTSFWLGAVHAATPGHGKTIAASYIVGVRGRPVDALVLGIFVTLSHTSGIVLVAALATIGSAWLIPQRVEAYLAIGTGILVIGIGGWMLRTQARLLSLSRARTDAPSAHVHASDPDAPHHHHGDADGPSDHGHHGHSHSHPQAHGPQYHSHGWGLLHTHDIEAIAQARPSLAMLLGLSIAGGLLPDPAALAILLSAIASGKLILGLLYRARLQPGVCVRARRRGCGRRACGTGHPHVAEQSLDVLDPDRRGPAHRRRRPRPDRERAPNRHRTAVTRSAASLGPCAVAPQHPEPSAEVGVPDVVRPIDSHAERAGITPGQRELLDRRRRARGRACGHAFP